MSYHMFSKIGHHYGDLIEEEEEMGGRILNGYSNIVGSSTGARVRKWQFLSDEQLQQIKETLWDDFNFRSGKEEAIRMVDEIEEEQKYRKQFNPTKAQRIAYTTAAVPQWGSSNYNDYLEAALEEDEI